MKIFFLLLFPALSAIQSSAQKQVIKNEVLSDKEVTNIFGDKEKSDLELVYPIFKVYKYADKSGVFYVILTESRDSTGTDKENSNKKIRAVIAKYENGRFINKWEINDFADAKKEEQNIWFWTKYAEFKDYDNDAEVDPVIVYGTSAADGIYQGQVKFVIYYHEKKIFILCQDSDLDQGRAITVDKDFYSLPEKLQESIKDKIELIEKNNQAHFPSYWQKAMADKKTLIKESN